MLLKAVQDKIVVPNFEWLKTTTFCQLIFRLTPRPLTKTFFCKYCFNILSALKSSFSKYINYLFPACIWNSFNKQNKYDRTLKKWIGEILYIPTLKWILYFCCLWDDFSIWLIEIYFPTSYKVQIFWVGHKNLTHLPPVIWCTQ